MLKNKFSQSMRRYLGIVFAIIASMNVMVSVGYAKPSVYDILDYGPPEDMSSPMAATVTFLQVPNTSGGTDATSISKITLNYFTSTDCSGSAAGTYTTPNGTSFPISTSTTFNLNATSTYSVGNAIPLTMSNMNSVAIFLKSTDSNTPQANFKGSCGTNPSFCCVRINCSSGTQCTATSAIGTQNLQLKTTATIGDPADGGVIGCQNTGSEFNLFNIVVTTSDQSTSQGWGGFGTATSATSTTNGATNTAVIVNCLTNGIGGGCTGGLAVATYAAGNCSTYSSSGGFTSGWFLPSGSTTNSQVNCLYNNKVAIAAGSLSAGGAGFANTGYWSSTDANSSFAWQLNFSNGAQGFGNKTNNLRVRCVRAF